MQRKMYLFDPQCDCKGPVKSRLKSSFGSNLLGLNLRLGGSSLICEFRIILFKLLPVIVHSEQFIP